MALSRREQVRSSERKTVRLLIWDADVTILSGDNNENKGKGRVLNCSTLNIDKGAKKMYHAVFVMA